MCETSFGDSPDPLLLFFTSILPHLGPSVENITHFLLSLTIFCSTYVIINTFLLSLIGVTFFAFARATLGFARVAIGGVIKVIPPDALIGQLVTTCIISSFSWSGAHICNLTKRLFNSIIFDKMKRLKIIHFVTWLCIASIYFDLPAAFAMDSPPPTDIRVRTGATENSIDPAAIFVSLMNIFRKAKPFTGTGSDV